MHLKQHLFLNYPRQLPFFSGIFFLLLFFTLLVVSDPLLLSAKQIELVKEQYGEDAVARVMQWQDLLIANRQKNERDKLIAVNDYFNQMKFISDKSHWGIDDYWATPIEFIATQAGDCEDFSIAKYFSLLQLGLDIEKLRLVYVKSRSINQAHMVLAYYSSSEPEPLILDNLDKTIKPSSERSDLIPSYSFNGETLWSSKELRSRGAKIGKTGNIEVWKMLIDRMSQGK
ncbi:MAG: transglutaminase-like cysteine peptidase [Gammaproteobacteria bacterium]|nr:transglutaminase-like cysteine peptidase [Gammaproteobacteria bacterium]